MQHDPGHTSRKQQHGSSTQVASDKLALMVTLLLAAAASGAGLPGVMSASLRCPRKHSSNICGMPVSECRAVQLLKHCELRLISCTFSMSRGSSMAHEATSSTPDKGHAALTSHLSSHPAGHT